MHPSGEVRSDPKKPIKSGLKSGLKRDPRSAKPLLGFARARPRPISPLRFLRGRGLRLLPLAGRARPA